MYTIEALEHGIEQAKKHIDSLEIAIENERNTIKEYRIMIEGCELQKKIDSVQKKT